MMAKSATPWYVKPAVVLPTISALVLLTALFARQPRSGREGDPRLTTHSREAQGASALYEIAQRLGWSAQRRNSKTIETAPDIIHAELDPAVPLRATEVHELLEHVRKGGALFLVMDQDSSILADSLNIKLSGSSGLVAEPLASQTRQCKDETKLIGFVPLWPSNRAQLYTLAWKKRPNVPVDTLLRLEAIRGIGSAVVINVDATDPATDSVSDSIAVAHAAAMKAADSIAAADTSDTSTASAPFAVAPIQQGVGMLGIPLGAGRVVIASDPDVVRNDALRVCRFGLDIAAVRALEYLRDGGTTPRKRIVFDEFHQSYSVQPGTVRTVASFLGQTQAGHVLFQLLAASVVLLIALMPRVIPPRDDERVERRSPLEHVDALARAYAQVGGTRTAATLLVRGLRRRVERASSRAVDQNTNERFLDRLETTNPTLKKDIAVIRTGLTTSLSADEFAQLGAAITRVETSLARI